MHRLSGLRVLTGASALILIAACGQPAEKATEQATYIETVECVPVEDGGNYTIIDGKFVKANLSAPIEKPKPVVAAPVDRWSDAVEANLRGQGFSWLNLDIRRNLATLSGIAPTTDAKAAALDAGTNAILAISGGERYNIIDAIDVEGGESGVGGAVAALGVEPDLAACQKAFVDTMEGRKVQFRVGSATILDASARLLDAVSGIATLCDAYSVEIGGHTDRIGDAGLNQSLSQQRAESVLAYLASKGVSTSNLTAVGYGETRPIDTSGTRAGDALNRRTEFTVSKR